MTPADAIDWCLHRNADAPTCQKLREILPAVAAADATNRALLERCADLEKTLAMYKDEVIACHAIAQLLDTRNPELSGSFTGTPSERIRRQLNAMRNAFDQVADLEKENARIRADRDYLAMQAGEAERAMKGEQ